VIRHIEASLKNTFLFKNLAFKYLVVFIPPDDTS